MAKLNFRLCSILFILLICSQNLIILPEDVKDCKNKIGDLEIGYIFRNNIIFCKNIQKLFSRDNTL